MVQSVLRCLGSFVMYDGCGSLWRQVLFEFNSNGCYALRFPYLFSRRVLTTIRGGVLSARACLRFDMLSSVSAISASVCSQEGESVE